MREPADRPEVTYLATTVEGGTLLRAGDFGAWRKADLERLAREVSAQHGGRLLRWGPGEFLLVFPEGEQALSAARAIGEVVRDRSGSRQGEVEGAVGIHTGKGGLVEGAVGPDAERALRIARAAPGGVVLMSAPARNRVWEAVSPGSLRDLGVHRLADLRSEHLYRLVVPGTAAWADGRVIRTPDEVPNNLPTQRTSFVDRDEQVREAIRLLRRSPLLTLTGSPGVGKTRLALALAAEVAGQFKEGVFLVSLAPLSDPALLASAIIAGLQIPEVPGTSPGDLLAGYLADRRILLVLDNFEHLLEAAPVVSDLVHQSPGLKVLVTSRSPLHVYGEQQLQIPALGAPNEKGESGIEGVELFVERATMVSPAFRLETEELGVVTEVVARVDGLPLAIELAAARVKLLPLPTLVERLSLQLLTRGPADAPNRHRTLWNTIAWSYNLLADPEQRLLERIGVFAGGSTLPELEEVCGPAEELGVDVFDGVVQLVDHNLVMQPAVEGEARFSLLQTIREFALERLAARGEIEEIRRRHAEVFLAIAETAAPYLPGGRQGEWMDRLTLEYGNLRAGLDWAIEEQRAELALRFLAALWRFWQLGGRVAEAANYVEKVMAVPGGDAHPRARAKALEAAGGLAFWQGDLETARRLHGESLQLLRGLEDRPGMANALYNVALAHLSGDHQAARSMLEESRAIFVELGDQSGVAKVVWLQGSLARWEGRPEEALSLLEEAAGMARRLGDDFRLAWALAVHGWTATDIGQLSVARSDLVEALEMVVRNRDRSAIPFLLLGFSELAVREGDPQRALRLAGAMTSFRQAMGVHLLGVAEERAHGLEEAAQAVGEEGAEAALTEGRTMTLEQAVAYALSGT